MFSNGGLGVMLGVALVLVGVVICAVAGRRREAALGVAGTEDWQDANPEQLIKEADVALYRAKELGRNRSVLAKPSGLQEIQMSTLAEEKVPAR